MSQTGRTLIRKALKLIGVTAGSETPSAQDQADSLIVLNEMLDSWSTQSTLVFTRAIETFTFTPSKQTYTMGVGGDFNTSRPQKLYHVATVDNSVTPANEIPIQIINLDQWAQETIKGTTSTIATKVYADFSNPLVTLNFWPVPTLANGVRIYSWKPLSQLATVDTVIDLPPGYAMALRYNLAICLAPEFQRPIDPALAAVAASTLENIQRANFQPLYMDCDPAIIPVNRTWDWRTGE